MQRMAVAGGYDCNFVDPVPDELTCPVCLFPCRSPHVLSCCGLKICENCVGPIEASCNPACPKCRESFTHFLEKDVDRQILGRNVRCPRNADGCEWVDQLRHLDKHVRDECKWTPVQCRLAGCSISVPRHQLEVHEKEECPRRPMEVKFEVFTRKMEERYGKEMTELREKYDALLVAHAGSKFKGSFSADKMVLIGIATSVLLALLIYVSTRSLLKNNSLQPLYILHQLAHWAMVYYAQTHLKCSQKLQPFHYWMAGMNLVFMLLYIVKSYIIPDSVSYRLPKELLALIVLGLSYWLLIAKSNSRGLIFGYFVPKQGIAEVAEKCLPYYFSFAVLFNFWYEPFIDRYMYFFLRLVVELIFITQSCLIQTYAYENKYLSILLELMVLPYFFITFLFPIEPQQQLLLAILTLSLVCAAMFAISQMHGLNFLTRMIKIIIIVLLISFAILLELWNPHNDSPGVIVCILTGYYYIGLIVIMVVLTVINIMIGHGTLIKKKE